MTLADKFVQAENASRKQGLEEGESRGRAEGMEIAERKAVEVMAETLKELGLSPEQIKVKLDMLICKR